MKTIRIILYIFFSCLMLVSCQKDTKDLNANNNYLPLEIGNYWQFEYYDKTEIVGTKVINSNIYYELKQANNSSYYRIENGKVIVEENGDNAAIKFNLSAKVRDSWMYKSYIVTLESKTDTLTINNQKIANCFCFSFDIPKMFDDEMLIWLAPNIGFVRESCGECAHINNELKKAKIGGKELY